MGHLAHVKKIAAGLAVVGALTAMSVAPALAEDLDDTSTASATVNAGDRAVTLDPVAFAAIGYQFSSHTITVADIAMTIVDNSGSNAGVQVSMSSTDLDNGDAGVIPATGFKVTVVDAFTQTDGTGGVPPISGSGVPAGNLGVGQVVASAVVGTGAGSYDADVDFSLEIPTNTLADAYSGLLTTTIVVAP